MKANGMKAWRKAARRWRRKQNRRSGAPYSDGTGRWYRRQQAWFHQRPAVPHRLFTPRSLVGMSQRRRKYLAWLLWSTTAGSFDFARKHYRVGQSLRPCPGCLQCQPKACDGCGFTLGSGEDCEVCDAHAVDRYVMGCDGSGVLPANR